MKMCDSIVDVASSLTHATAMLSRNCGAMSPDDLKVSAKVIEALAYVLRTDVEEMDYINRLHEYSLANSLHFESVELEALEDAYNDE